VYGLLVTIEDGHGNTNTTSIALTVEDTTNPVWSPDPEDQVCEFGAQFVYDLDAFDLAGINSWLIDDLVNFTIDSNGVVMNNTYLEVGNYSLRVFATDGHGLLAVGDFVLEVKDTTPPAWVSNPGTQDLEFGEQLSLQLQASDLAGIIQWQINNTIDFTITDTGFLTSLDNLASGWYYVEVTVTDGHGLSSSLVVSVFVSLTTVNPIDPLFLALAIGGIGIGAVVLFASLRVWRSIQRDRLAQLENGKGEVDTALDYMESIKETLEGEDGDT
jgi:hypothetical protein